jgi:hypothetical protein
MQAIEVNIIDSLFGVCYQIAMVVSAKMYSMFASDNVVYSGTVVLFFMFVFFGNYLRSIFSGATLFSPNAEGFTANNPLKGETFFKVIFSIILLLLLFLPIQVRLTIKQQASTLQVPPDRVAAILETIKFSDVCKVSIDNSTMSKNTGNGSSTNSNQMEVTQSSIQCREPYIVGLSLGLVDYIYNVLVDGILGLFPTDMVNKEDLNIKNFNIFAEFSVSTSLLDIKTKLFQGITDVSARATDLVSLNKPELLWQNDVTPEESESSKLPKLDRILFLPTEKPLSIAESNSQEGSIDNYIPSAALYIILNKFNYLSKYGADEGNIGKSTNNEDDSDEYKVSSFAIFKNDLDYFKSDPLSTKNYLQYFYNKKQAIPYITKALEKETPWNLNQLSSLENMLIAHPELAIFLLNMFSWVRFDANSSESIASLQAYASTLTNPKDKKKYEKYIKNYIKAINADKPRGSTLNPVVDAKDRVNLRDAANDPLLFNTSIERYKNTKDDLYKKLSDIETISNSSTSAYDKAIEKYSSFLQLYFSGNTISLSTMFLGQAAANKKISCNSFSFNPKDYNWEFYDKLEKEVIDVQIAETKKLITLIGTKYLPELNSIKNTIIESQGTNNKVTNSNFSSIGQGGLTYLNSTIDFWDNMMTTATAFHDQLNLTKGYLNTFVKVAKEAEKKYSAAKPEDLEKLGENMNLNDLRIYKSTHKMGAGNDGRFILFNMFEPVAKQYDDNNKDLGIFSWDYKKIGKNISKAVVTAIVKAALWVILYIFLLLCLLLLFYIMIQRIVAFIMFFCCWPILFFKAASSSKFGQPIIAIITSWASYRAFDLSIIIGLLFAKIMQSLTVNTSIYSSFIFGEYSQDAIQALGQAMVIFSILISLLIIRFLYTSLNSIITNNFDVVSESLNKVSDKAIANAGQMSSMAIGGAKFLASIVPLIGPLLSAGGSAIGKVVNKGSSDVKNILDSK